MIALAASLGANIATAGLLDLENVPDWLRILVAGWPALAFLGGTLLAHTAPPAPVQDAAPVVPEVEQIPVPESPAEREQFPESEPVPALPEAPAPAPPPVPVPAAAASGVPPALIEHARKLAEAHRVRTGEHIDTGTLRARLGVPEALAHAIAAQLA